MSEIREAVPNVFRLENPASYRCQVALLPINVPSMFISILDDDHPSLPGKYVVFLTGVEYFEFPVILTDDNYEIVSFSRRNQNSYHQFLEKHSLMEFDLASRCLWQGAEFSTVNLDSYAQFLNQHSLDPIDLQIGDSSFYGLLVAHTKFPNSSVKIHARTAYIDDARNFEGMHIFSSAKHKSDTT